MTTWKLRSPDRFPPAFAATFEAAARELLTGKPTGPHILADRLTLAEARAMADRFRWFRWCLRQYPVHGLHNLELSMDFRLRRHIQPVGHALILTVRRKPDASPLEQALKS